MCPDVLFDERGVRIPPLRPDSGFTEREKHALRQLDRWQLKKRGISSYLGWKSSKWIDNPEHGVLCPIGLDDSCLWPFWTDTQVVGAAEPEVLVWWLCKLGHLPFQYCKRRLAKERVTNMVGLDAPRTRAWLRGFGTICLSRGQTEQIIRTLEESLARQEAAAESLVLETSPSLMASRRLRSCDNRPLGEFIWAEMPHDACNSAWRWFLEPNDRSRYGPSLIKEKKNADEAWLCPVQWWYAPNPAPFECFLDPVIVLGNSLHALREREKAWSLRLRQEFQELRTLYEYAASLLTVTSIEDWRTTLSKRPHTLSIPKPHVKAETAAQARRVLVPHPDMRQKEARMSSEAVYAQLAAFADCSIGDNDMSEAMCSRPMSAKEQELGKVYDEILLLLDQAHDAGSFAMIDSFEGWEGLWPKLSGKTRGRLGELFSQKSELLFELQGELNLPVCNCPVDAPAAAKDWQWTGSE